MQRLAPAAAVAVVLAVAVVAGATAVGGDERRYHPLPSDAPWTTVFDAPAGIEGLTTDRRGNLYTPGRAGGGPCPIYRTSPSGASAAVVGTIAGPCNPAGLAFDRDGDLFVADSGRILTLRPDAAAPPTATVYADGVPGSNGVAFDKRGDLWVSDGGTGQGRVWRIGVDRTPVEVFRVQPIANDVNLVNGVGGVGRDVRGLPPGAVTITPNGRQAANTEGSQHLVANGLAFDRRGTLFVADTARGAIWRVSLDDKGRVRSRTGCDTTFPPNTLCLDNVFVQHPYLDGADGIVLDRGGNILVAANERNAIVVVTNEGRAIELFRNA
ncbi:MAG TPA: SMP-30/gluconolactonase/LRE family protein, partial [Candidatus Limnocylindrales bacterium]|nr:SMP-30/gluconolactonase/LRE family protein [Candidatus Limnocylindrales bacterium]